MSNEVLEVIKQVDIKSLEIQIAIQCAPLLSGLKISNLLKVNKNAAVNINKTLAGTSISYFKMYESRENVTFLLYTEEEVKKYIHKEASKNLMETLGYGDFNLTSVLKVFGHRYRMYMKNKGNFPHEMGILLGYPVEDVIGFIDNHGKNSLYIGYWKVYSHVEEKVKLFERFQKAQDLVVKLIVCGFKVNQVTKTFKNNNKLLNAAV